MRIIIEDRGKRYEVVRCGEGTCGFCKHDSADESCSKRCYAPRRFFNALQRATERGVGFKEVVDDELAKQREYDRKLEADFAALLADRNDLAEKNRACCAENERLHEVCRKLCISLKNRMPSQPTLEELELIGEAETALEKAGGAK